MEATRNQFKSELLTRPLDVMASIWILDRVPVIFNNDREQYALWKHQLAKGLGVDPSSVVVTGSCAFGVSLNPYKNYRFFDEDSDIDVAVMSDYHFTEAWRALRNLGSSIHGLRPAVKSAVHDHVSKYIYWGTIATDRILPILPFGKEWREAMDEMQRIAPAEGRSINARIYRDFDSLRSYQVNNLRGLLTTELEKDAENV